MSKFIEIEEIEDSRWTYLQHLEELMTRLTWYELKLDRIILRLQLEVLELKTSKQVMVMTETEVTTEELDNDSDKKSKEI